MTVSATAKRRDGAPRERGRADRGTRAPTREASSGREPKSAGQLAVIVASLEEEIVLGQLHPRERLIEEDLCARFGISRHILRLAFAELDRMGLVERIPNRGALVRAFSREDVEQLYSLRQMLEAAGASQIPLPVDAADLRALRAIQTRHDAAVAKVDLAQVFRVNREFHRKLFSLCGNSFLAGAIEAYAQQAHGIRFMVLADAESRGRARDEHHLMIEAMARGDRRELVRLCRNHLPASRDAYLRGLGGCVD